MRIVTTTLLLLLLAAAPVAAHGVRTEVAVGAMTVATFVHEDGAPMAGVPFTVQAPGDGGTFLSGSTDLHGRVAFLPDRAGAWKVRVAGADGHGAVVTISVDSTAVAMTRQEGAAVYAHDHEKVELDAAAGHDHADGADHGHVHEAQTREAPLTGGSRRSSGAVAAGVGVLVVVFGVVFILLRRRAG